jgi:CRP-like cAMP-binding protein
MVEVRAPSSIATYQKFHAHEYLCRQGDLADGIIIILTGVAAIIVDGKQV